MLIVWLYVNDLIYVRNDRAMFEKFKKSVMLEFDMSDLGMLQYFQGIEVKQFMLESLFHKRNMCKGAWIRFR